ncbi:MAG: hypothetical protein JXA21_15780 [Anaerolineae bacterium]|nr:hypothetical protein [Anaerolineae bacterium]
MRKRLLYIGLILLVLTGCTERARTPRVLPEWGRAGRVGRTSHLAPVGLVVSPDGDRVVMAWPSQPEGMTEEYIHLLVLDGSGNVVAEQNLEPPITYLQGVQLLAGPDGALHIVWSAGRQAERSVWYASLPSLGSLGSAPLAALDAYSLSTPEDTETDVRSVDWFKAALLPSGEVLVLWEEGRGHVFARLAGQSDAREILSGAQQIAFQSDAAGQVHIVWLTYEIVTELLIYRAMLDTESLTLSSSPQLVTTIDLPGRASPSTVDGLALSLDHTHVYLSWTQQQALLTMSLPLDAGAFPGEAHPFQAVTYFPPPTMPATGYFAYQNLAMAGGRASGAATVRQAPATIAEQGDEAVMVLPVLFSTRTRQEFQPTVIYWRDGVPRGYQALTWTQEPSIHPSIAMDTQCNLYVAWVDLTGRDHYPVYVASTAELHDAWQYLTWDDAGAMFVDYASRTASGLVLFPLVVMWFFFPLIWLFVMLSKGDTYGARGLRILLVALLIYEASKYVLTQRVLTYVPMQAYLPPSLTDLLIYGIPVLTLLISFGLVGTITLYRAGKNFSVMRTYIFTTLLDAALSLMVYGIGYWE